MGSIQSLGEPKKVHVKEVATTWDLAVFASFLSWSPSITELGFVLPDLGSNPFENYFRRFCPLCSMVWFSYCLYLWGNCISNFNVSDIVPCVCVPLRTVECKNSWIFNSIHQTWNFPEECLHLATRGQSCQLEMMISSWELDLPLEKPFELKAPKRYFFLKFSFESISQVTPAGRSSELV